MLSLDSTTVQAGKRVSRTTAHVMHHVVIKDDDNILIFTARI